MGSNTTSGTQYIRNDQLRERGALRCEYCFPFWAAVAEFDVIVFNTGAHVLPEETSRKNMVDFVSELNAAHDRFPNKTFVSVSRHRRDDVPVIASDRWREVSRRSTQVRVPNDGPRAPGLPRNQGRGAGTAEFHCQVAVRLGPHSASQPPRREPAEKQGAVRPHPRRRVLRRRATRPASFPERLPTLLPAGPGRLVEQGAPGVARLGAPVRGLYIERVS